MENLLWTMGIAATGLFALAVGVACWEHRRALRDRPWSATAIFDRPVEGAPPTEHVDVDLGTLEPPSPEQRRRGATLEAAYGSMVHGPGTTRPAPWVDTRPIVQAGLAPAARQAPHLH